MTDLPEKKMVHHLSDVPDVKVDMKSEDVSQDPSSNEMPKVRFIFFIRHLHTQRECNLGVHKVSCVTFLNVLLASNLPVGGRRGHETFYV